MKRYRVKVTELHTDIVWVEADSDEEAKDLAVGESNCTFDCSYDCEILVSLEEDEDYEAT